MSIELKKVSKYFGEHKAIDQISFTVGKGEIVGFLGPNGAGKSTTMKMICGYTTPTSGTIYVNGLSVKDHPIAIKKSIGYLPENNPLYHDMYVREYLRFVAEVLGIADPKKRIDYLLEKIEVKEESLKKIGELSKGYRQRVGLVAALLGDPEVLILDEPTVGLDPNQIKTFKSLILSLSKEKTILLSSHILSDIEALCKRCIIIHKGKLIADDDLQTLKKREQQKRTTVVICYEVQDVFPIQELEKQVGVPIKSIREGEIEIDLPLDIALQQKIAHFFNTHAILLSSIKQKEIAVDELFSILTQSSTRTER